MLRAARAPLCALLVMLFTGGTALPAGADYYYFCPRGNASLVGNDHYLYGKASTPFPDGSARGRKFSVALDWTLRDCGDARFLCLEIRDGRGLRQRLFVPRRPIVGRQYTYDGASAFVTATSSAGSIPTVQVTIRQNAGSDSEPLKLTLRRGVGAVYVDGLHFAGGEEFHEAGSCVLESRTGFFHDAMISSPAPTKIIDY